MTDIIVVSDLHSGHYVGITPPEYQIKEVSGRSKRSKHASIQKETWDWFRRTLKQLDRPAKCFVIGDMIDGDGCRSGGTELITTDRIEQANIATTVLEYIGAKDYNFVYGTGYHTGNEEDYEDIIAKHFGAKIGSHEWIRYKGKTFDLKHHLKGSAIPHGRLTPLSKEVMANEAWHSRGEQPKADCLIRGHVHQFNYLEQRVGSRVVKAFTSPALQAYGSKFGARRCSEPVDVGFVSINIDKDGIHVTPHIAHLSCLKAS